MSESLLKNKSTRLKFSVYVIIANFIIGIIGMIFNFDLYAIGTFLAMSNAPLYAYIIGRSLRGSMFPMPPRHHNNYNNNNNNNNNYNDEQQPNDI